MTASNPVGFEPAPGPGAVTPPKNKMPKVAFASFMGTVIEFYDFGIYGTAAALVFASSFFPALGDQAGTVVSFATLGIAFAARPLGAILFGHWGDRLGRKKTLLATMLLMGTATVLIGLLPTAASIGVAAPIILIVLRVAQGIAAGGEWGGAALFTSENAPPASRGFWAMFTNLGGAVANILALTTFLITGLTMSEETFAAWGWRVPFLISIVLVAVGLYIRLKIEETPVFAKEVRAHGTSKLPVKEAFANQWKTILLGAGCMITFFAFGYLGVAYMTNYGTASLGFSRQMVLAVGVIGAFIQGLAMINGGALSDRIGRRKVLLIFGGIAVPWALILFPLLDTKSVGMYWFALIVTFIIAGHGYGIAGSFLSELFETRYRYTAAGLSYSLAGIVGGAIPPLLAASIITAYGSFTFGLILTGFCLVSFLCILALKETREVSLAHVQEDQAEQAAA
jgi:MFS family permease